MQLRPGSSVMWGFASAALNSLVGLDCLTWNAGPSLTTPIFNRGRLKGNAQVARAEGRIALAEYERSIQSAFREVTDALAGRRYLAEQVAAQDRAAIAQRSIAQLARTRYIEGVASYLEVLDAQRTANDAELAFVRNRQARLAFTVDLMKALGGGWK